MPHTPGPWSVIPQTNGDQLIAHKHGNGGLALRIIGFAMTRPASAEEDLSNAILLAAAPDLLAALKEADHLFTTFGTKPVDGSVHAIVRAAIRKATQPTE